MLRVRCVVYVCVSGVLCVYVCVICVWCSVYVGCTPEHKAYCKPYLGYLSLLPTILQVPEVKESVIRAAGGGGRAGFGRGPSSIPTQLPCVQQFEVPPF